MTWKVHHLLWIIVLIPAAVFANTITESFSFSSEDVTCENVNGYDLFSLPDTSYFDETPGTPLLPVKTVSILIPTEATVTDITVDHVDMLYKENCVVFPTQPMTPLSEEATSFVDPDETAYTSTTPTPETAAELIGTATLRGYKIVNIRLNPLQYIPANKLLFLNTSITVTVNYTLAEPSTLWSDSASFAKNTLFTDMIKELVVNPEALENAESLQWMDNEPTATVDYLIITSASLSNAFQELASHRASFNTLNTVVMTTEYIESNYSGTTPSGGSDTQTKIRNCIIDFVQNFGTTYVVLGGDNTVVPDRDCYVTYYSYTSADMPTDLYYAGLDSTWDENANGIYGEANYSGTSSDEGDLAFDVIVGRIPVRTSGQATDYINKLKSFENNPLPSGFCYKTLICGNELWNGDFAATDTCNDGHLQFNAHSPKSDAEVWGRRMYRDAIQAYWPTNTLSYFFDTLTSWDTSTPGNYQQNSTTVQLRFNENWYHLFFGTHGNKTIWGLESGTYYSSTAAALTGTTAFVYTMACLTGAFDTAEPSLSEAFLRNPNGGALAYLGCSRYGWGSKSSFQGGTSMNYAYKYYDQIFNQKRSTIGEAYAYHKLAYQASCYNNNTYRWIQFGVNLQGDPLVPITINNINPGNDDFWFHATALTNSVVLRWPDPVSCGLLDKTVHIRVSTSDYPTDTSNGTEVYTGTNTCFEHTSLNNGQPYYYTIWVSNNGSTFVDPP